MTPEDSIARLLRWRQDRGAADAPPPPGAAQLVALARPWWEAAPARLLAQVERLRQVPLAYGYASTADARGGAGHPVPVLVDAGEEAETYAHVLYLVVRGGRMRVRFQLAADAAPLPGDALDVIFVPDAPEAAPFAGTARRAQGGAWRADVALPDDAEWRWATLRVTDRLPFRLVLRPA